MTTHTSDNPNAPVGNQVAFVKNNGLLSQNWNPFPGTYTLSFRAAQRGSGNDSYQQLRVNLRSSASVISAKTFVWCGNQICEERDSTGANVTKRFFAEGEQRVGGGDAGNYYYSRDQLGSIREVTNSSGSVNARYDYDVWDNSVVVDGKMNVDFGYTGHYFHAPSGLNLTLYRAYNPALGRWMSRDPIGEAGGINLYAYVGNDPIDLWDPLGLEPPSSPRCQELKRSIEAKERILPGKYRELADNRRNLPQSAPGDDVKLGLTINSHLQQIAQMSP